MHGCLCMCFMWAGRGHTAENTVGSCFCDLSSNNTESLGYMLDSIQFIGFTFLQILFIKAQFLEINGARQFLYLKFALGHRTWVLESGIVVSTVTLVEPIT